MSERRDFTEEEVRLVLNPPRVWGKWQVVARAIGCTEQAAKALAHRLRKGKRALVTAREKNKEERKQLAEEYLSTNDSLAKIACRRGVTPSAIYKRLIREGVDAEVREELRHEIKV